MDVEDEPLLHEDHADEIDIEENDEILDDEIEGNADEESEDLAGTADGQGQEAGRQEEVRQPSRAERRVQQALTEAKAAKAETERLRLEIQQARTAQPVESQAQRQERLMLMDPDQRVDYLLRERQQQEDARFARLEFQMADSADRTAFEGLCARNPVAAKLKTNVEDYLAEMRRNGTTAPRETVLRYVIGDRALANAPRATTRARNTADANRQRQAARPGAARSDAGGSSRTATNEAEARRKRLEDMQI